MNLMKCMKNGLKQTKNWASKNKAGILTTSSVTLELLAVLSAIQESPNAKLKIDEVRDSIEERKKTEAISKPTIAWEYTKNVAPCFWKTALFTASSIACTIGSYKVSSGKIAAFSTALALSEDRYSTYRKKMREIVGEKKDDEVKAEVAKEMMEKTANKTDISKEEFIAENAEGGGMLFYDAWSGRYFRSDVDTIRKTESILNRRLYIENFITLNEFYSEIGLKNTRMGEDTGWSTETEIDFDMSGTTMAPNNEPCIMLDYILSPKFDYGF